MGGIKNSIDLELEILNPSPHVFFPFTFFMINDSNKVIHTITQNMVMMFAILFSKLHLWQYHPKKEKCDHI
jgi:hypothetical protein